MPVDPLEEAREKIIREAVTRTRNLSNYPHHARQAQAETIIAETGAALAELDRRSPPTREGEPVYVGPYSPGSNEWWFVRRVATSDVRRTWYELTDADREALAATPPPPDVSRGLDREEVIAEATEYLRRSGVAWTEYNHSLIERLVIALSAPTGGAP